MVDTAVGFGWLCCADEVDSPAAGRSHLNVRLLPSSFDGQIGRKYVNDNYSE